MAQPHLLHRHLGSQGLSVSALGLGCMSMSQSYGPADEVESLATLERALELGVNFFDTANAYGDGHNESLIGRFLKGRRERVTVATKFGIVHDSAAANGICGRPDYVRRCCEESLQRLGTDHIDLYYQHRVDPEVPIEETVGAMGELVQQGKVRYLGLSEASADSLERAARTHPITALQSEWSLWTRDLEEEVLPVARRLGIGIVPYSPLGRGFLSGKITSTEDFGEDDFRRHNPRFQGENFERNLALVGLVRQLAEEKGVTPAQLALAWLLAQGDDVVPIPGTKRRTNLMENLGALEVPLSPEDRDRLSSLIPPGSVSGTRYPDAGYRYGSSPAPS
ncbi:MAG: aldo/keto reductase [Candidatus Dormibacteria bacterium]